MSELGQKLIGIVREKAAENPSFVYEAITIEGHRTCIYVHEGKPSCLIGHALWDAGLIDATLTGQQNVAVDGLCIDLGLGLDEDEISWLSDVQDAQDFFVAWGEAVDRADRNAEDDNA